MVPHDTIIYAPAPNFSELQHWLPHVLFTMFLAIGDISHAIGRSRTIKNVDKDIKMFVLRFSGDENLPATDNSSLANKGL